MVSANSSSPSDRMKGTAEEQLRQDSLRAKQETKILSQILNRLRNQLNSTSSNIDRLISGGEYYGADYQAERRVLMEASNIGVTEGIVATTATFLFLRQGPRIVQRILSRRFKNHGTTPSPPSSSMATTNKGGYKLDPRPTETTNPFKQSVPSTNTAGARSAAENPANKPVGTATRAFVWTIKLVVDVFASMLMGAYTSLYFTDDERVLRNFAALPLIEGRSLVADELCEAVHEEFAKLPPEWWSSARSPYLRNIKLFAENCSRRRAFEKAIVREQATGGPERPLLGEASSSDVHVAIPPPGVPADYELDTSFTFSENGETGEDWLRLWNEEHPQPTDEANFSDWAEGMVEDSTERTGDNKKRPW